MTANRRIELRVSDEFLVRLDQACAAGADLPRATVIKEIVQYTLGQWEGADAEMLVAIGRRASDQV